MIIRCSFQARICRGWCWFRRIPYHCSFRSCAGVLFLLAWVCSHFSKTLLKTPEKNKYSDLTRWRADVHKLSSHNPVLNHYSRFDMINRIPEIILMQTTREFSLCRCIPRCTRNADGPLRRTEIQCTRVNVNAVKGNNAHCKLSLEQLHSMHSRRMILNSHFT